MAVTHPTTIRDTLANAIATAVDAGAGNGQMVLKVTGTVVSTIPFNKPAFGGVGSSNGTLTLDVSPVPEDPSAVGNASLVNVFTVEDSEANIVFQGAVPADLTLSRNPVAAGDVVQITSFTYSAPN